MSERAVIFRTETGAMITVNPSLVRYVKDSGKGKAAIIFTETEWLSIPADPMEVAKNLWPDFEYAKSFS